MSIERQLGEQPGSGVEGFSFPDTSPASKDITPDGAERSWGIPPIDLYGTKKPEAPRKEAFSATVNHITIPGDRVQIPKGAKYIVDIGKGATCCVSRFLNKEGVELVSDQIAELNSAQSGVRPTLEFKLDTKGTKAEEDVFIGIIG